MEAIPIRLEAIAIRLQVITSRLKAFPIRLENNVVALKARVLKARVVHEEGQVDKSIYKASQRRGECWRRSSVCCSMHTRHCSEESADRITCYSSKLCEVILKGVGLRRTLRFPKNLGTKVGTK